MALATDYINARAGIADGLLEKFADLAGRVVRNHQYRQTVSSLSALTDRDLADLGLKRSEIRRIAYHATYGK